MSCTTIYYPPLDDMCLVCDAVAPSPGTPSRVETSAVFGWTASARSVDELSDDGLRVRWQVGQSTGIVLGLTPPDLFTVGARERIVHAWYLYAQGPALLAQPMEYGVLVGEAIARDADDVWEIRRQGGSVVYLQNEAVIYRSTVLSAGTVCVATCLYASGDTVH